MSRRPAIAVGGERLAPGDVKIWRGVGAGVPTSYIRPLHAAGGVEAILAPEHVDEDEVASRLEAFDGVLMIGGADVHPAAYGEDPHPACYGLDEEQDAFDLALARSAVRLGMPLLAICRGMQAMNVAFGGTLDQHISDRPGLLEHGKIRGGERVLHEVDLEPGSLVAKAMGVDRASCESSHHQAVARVGQGLRVTGTSSDGVVEAIEHEDAWAIGVQWHPERTVQDDPAQLALFQALVDQARA